MQSLKKTLPPEAVPRAKHIPEMEFETMRDD
jgi:hypothetical protein